MDRFLFCWLIEGNRSDFKKLKAAKMFFSIKEGTKELTVVICETQKSCQEIFCILQKYTGEMISSSWASNFLDQWTTKVMRSKIEPLKREAKTIRRHKPLILNWFKAKKQFSSGIVEGLNNKVKLTMRKSYGF